MLHMLYPVAVSAKQLVVALRPSISLQPSVESPTPESLFSLMASVISNVIHVQNKLIRDATPSTLSAVGFKHLLPNINSVLSSPSDIVFRMKTVILLRIRSGSCREFLSPSISFFEITFLTEF